MTVAELRDSPDVPPGVADEVVALWHDARGDWERAHQTVQDLDTPAATVRPGMAVRRRVCRGTPAP